MKFIYIHSVIIYVVFFGACMRCTRLCSLKPGCDSYWLVHRTVNSSYPMHRTVNSNLSGAQDSE
jgi:hypothetical protein